MNVRKPGLGNKMSSLGIVFTDTDDSHDEESEIESESSWERENRFLYDIRSKFAIFQLWDM